MVYGCKTFSQGLCMLWCVCVCVWVMFLSDFDYSVAARSDAGLYNCSFTLGTSDKPVTFSESINITGRFLLILFAL